MSKQLCIRVVSATLSLGALLAAGCQAQSDGGKNATPSTATSASPAVVPSVPGPSASTGVDPSPSAAPTSAGSGVPSAPLEATQPAATLLSSAWAQAHSNASPGQEANARRLEQAGYASYKKRKDKDAVALYEQALSQQASSAIYYKYGNSLSNIDRLPDSVTAYERALELGFPSPEVVHYNIACSYSRLKQADEAHAALAKAVKEGYGALEKLNTDPDLAFLRARPDWQERTAKFAATPTHIAGKLVRYGDRDFQERYTMCPDGRVFRELMEGLDESCCGSRKEGTLSKKGDVYTASWTKRCGRKGVGGRKFEFEGEGCQPHKSCAKDEQCEAAKDSEELAKASELPGITQKVLGPPGEPGTAVYVPVNDAAHLPALCNTK